MREGLVNSLDQVTQRIIHLEYKTQKEVAEAFLRFQEHYESPEFRGKIFTRGQFHAWYSEDRGGATYRFDWGGFNVPGYVLDPFIKGLFDPLTKPEQEIVDLFRYRTDKFYLIGTSPDQKDAPDLFDHEVCHGLYYTCDEYKEKVDEELAKYDVKHIAKWLKKSGYCDAVLMDEVHAYVSASTNYLDEQDIVYDKELEKALISLYRKYLKSEKK